MVSMSTVIGFSALSVKLYNIQNDLRSNDQAQASDQFLATTKLATNKAICLKP
jgi:hypothetical protein